MKKIMLIGESGCGKTSLIQYLKEEKIDYHKTQQVFLDLNTIDTPGEFMENRFYYNALVSASIEADIIGFVQSLSSPSNLYPPNFSLQFQRPVIGIITKLDLPHSEMDLKQKKESLVLSGVTKIFPVSIITHYGIGSLKEYLSV